MNAPLRSIAVDGDLTWCDVGALEDIRPLGGRRVETPLGEIAVFRTDDDRVFALDNRCPHKGGPLSEGIVHGTSVTCPLHTLVLSLETGRPDPFRPARELYARHGFAECPPFGDYWDDPFSICMTREI